MGLMLVPEGKIASADLGKAVTLPDSFNTGM